MTDPPSLYLDTYLSVRQVADVLNVSEGTVRRHITAGRLGAVKAGGSIRVGLDDLERFLEPVGAEIQA